MVYFHWCAAIICLVPFFLRLSLIFTAWWVARFWKGSPMRSPVIHLARCLTGVLSICSSLDRCHWHRHEAGHGGNSCARFCLTGGPGRRGREGAVDAAGQQELVVRDVGRGDADKSVAADAGVHGSVELGQVRRCRVEQFRGGRWGWRSRAADRDLAGGHRSRQHHAAVSVARHREGLANAGYLAWLGNRGLRDSSAFRLPL